jgi:hypothetical protein
MRTDGHTEITKLIVAFRNFANAAKNYDKNLVPVSSYLRRHTICRALYRKLKLSLNADAHRTAH